MVRDLARRLSKLESLADMLPPVAADDGGGQGWVIRVYGGLPDTMHAVIDGQRHDAGPGELADAFEVRAVQLASEAGTPFCIIAGLPGRHGSPPEVPDPW